MKLWMGKMFIWSDFKCFCIVQIVFCASEAGIKRKQTASLVELNSKNAFRSTPMWKHELNEHEELINFHTSQGQFVFECSWRRQIGQ